MKMLLIKSEMYLKIMILILMERTYHLNLSMIQMMILMVYLMEILLVILMEILMVISLVILMVISLVILMEILMVILMKLNLTIIQIVMLIHLIVNKFSTLLNGHREPVLIIFYTMNCAMIKTQNKRYHKELNMMIKP